MISLLAAAVMLQTSQLRPDPGIEFAEKADKAMKQPTCTEEFKSFVLGYSLQRARGIASITTDELTRAHLLLCGQLAAIADDEIGKQILEQASLMKYLDGVQPPNETARIICVNSIKTAAAKDKYSKGDIGWSFSAGLIAGDLTFYLLSSEIAGPSDALEELIAMTLIKADLLGKLKPGAKLETCASQMRSLGSLAKTKSKSERIKAPTRTLLDNFLAINPAK